MMFRYDFSRHAITKYLKYYTIKYMPNGLQTLHGATADVGHEYFDMVKGRAETD